MQARNSGRVPLFLEVAAKVAGFPKPLPATILDLSLLGCRLTLRSVLLIGADIEFHLKLPGGPSPLARGKVRRCVPTDMAGVLEFGVEFIPFSGSDAAAIERFVEEERKRSNAESASTRVEVEFPVTCFIAGNKSAIAGIAIDIGRGGIRIACEQSFPEGSTLVVRFSLPNDGKEMEFRGRVVQRKHQFREYHHSVAFLDADNAKVERIERFMRSQR